MRCRAGCPHHAANLALLRITKICDNPHTGPCRILLHHYPPQASTWAPPTKYKKIPRTPGCNNGLPMQGISRFYLRLVLGACAWLNPAQKLRAQRCRHDGLDGVHPVFGFLEHDDCGPVNTSSVTSMASRPNFSPNLLANGGLVVVVGGQAVHEYGGRLCLCHQFSVYLIGGKRFNCARPTLQPVRPCLPTHRCIPHRRPLRHRCHRSG